MTLLLQVVGVVALAVAAMWVIGLVVEKYNGDETLGTEQARVPIVTAGAGLSFAGSILFLRVSPIAAAVGVVLAEAGALVYFMFGGTPS